MTSIVAMVRFPYIGVSRQISTWKAGIRGHVSLSNRSRAMVVPSAKARKKSSKKNSVANIETIKESVAEVAAQKDDEAAKGVEPSSEGGENVPEVSAESSRGNLASSATDGATEGVTKEALSVDEIAERMAELRTEKSDIYKKESFVEGVLEEIRLIKWPSPVSAVLNTLLVVAIVAGSSVILFGVNTLLAELSKEIYGRL